MAVCTHCWAGEMVLLNGMMTCEACGEVQQDFVEEQEEFMTGINDRGFFRKSTGHNLRAQRASTRTRERPPTRQALHAYVRAVQELLQRQAAALSSACGVDPQVEAVARQIWFAYLPLSGVLEEEYAESFNDRFDSHIPSDDEGEAPRPHNQMRGWQFYSLVMQQALSPVLHYRLTLSILLLACCYLREAVGPADITRWAADGRLPFLQFGLESWHLLAPYRKLLSTGFLTPKSVPGPRKLLQVAAELACQLGLEVPSLNAAAWLERYVRETGLPQELLPVSLQVCRLYRFGPQLALAAPAHPWSLLMAALLVSIKLCYGLDGRARPARPGLPAAPDWVRWAQQRLQTLSSSASFPTEPDKVLALSGRQFLGLMAYVTQVVAPPHRLTVRGWRRRTQQLTSPAFQALAAAAAVPPAAVEADVLLQEAQQPSSSQEQQPPLAADAYHFFDRALATGRGSSSGSTMPAEYASVLTVCAASTWITPHALHKLVVALEEQIISAECEVSYAHNQLEERRMKKAREWMDLAAAHG